MANGKTEFGAGAGIGTLLGLIMGLSASPVVSTVLGALSGGLLVLLGLASRPDGAGESKGELRVLGFGFFCSVFLVVGIFLRTHDVLAPSFAAEERTLSASSTLTKSEIHQILLLKALGLSADKEGTVQSVRGPASPYLFAGRGDVCQVLRRDLYSDPAGYLEALQAHGSDFEKLADSIKRLPTQEQDALATSLSNLLCK
jgi:hypothetical protein